MFLHIHRCLVALCIPKLGVSASHMKEHGVFPRVTLHQNVFMYEMWSSSGLGPLICHLGTPIFLSLSSGCLIFKCVMDLDLYPQGGSVASLASITFLCARFPCCNCLRPWSDPVSTCVCGLGRMSTIFFWQCVHSCVSWATLTDRLFKRRRHNNRQNKCFSYIIELVTAISPQTPFTNCVILRVVAWGAK